MKLLAGKHEIKYTTWPTVCRRPDMKTISYCLISCSKPLSSKALICCYNGLHSSGKTFHKVLEPGCRDLIPFSLRSITEAFQLTQMGSRSGLNACQSSSSIRHWEENEVEYCSLQHSTCISITPALCFKYRQKLPGGVL